MSLKAKILAAVKTKYKNLGFSDKVLDGIADMLAVTTTEEENIETAVAGVEPLLKGFQSDADTRVTAAVTKAKTEVAKPEEPKKEGGIIEPAKTEGAPQDFAKIIADALSPLVKEISDLKSGNVAKSRQQIIEDKLKDANPTYKDSVLDAFSFMTFGTEEDFNSYLTKIETKVAELKQAETNDQVKDIGKPFSGNGTLKETEVSPLMKQFITDRAAAAAKAAAPVV